jgi:hypothetical protein
MTKDDLDQIDQLIQKLLDANNKQLRQEIRADTKAEVDPLHERLDTLRGQIASVEKNLSDKITLEAEDVSEIIRDAIFPKFDKHDEKLADHDDKIAELQDKVGLKTHQH